VEGWIKLHRKLKEWEWYTDSKMVHLLIHLIMSANHEPKKWRGQEIGRGQLLTGRKQLSSTTGISEQSIRTCLERLKETKEITSKSTNQNSIITICNYDSYQQKEAPTNQQTNQQSTSQLTSDQPATNQRPTTNKNDKKDKKEKNDKNIPAFSEFLKFAISKNSNLDSQHVRLKFDAWVENGWKDGNNKKIVNWKSKLINTIPFLKEKNSAKKENELTTEQYTGL